MDCGHGWRCAADCDICTMIRIAPKASARIAALEAALRAITHRDHFTGNVVNSYIEDADLREYAPILDTIHPAK